LVVGGASECDIILTDPFASATHCSVQRIGERWILKDHDSKNGTRLNGTPVRLAEVRPGNQIVIGDTRLDIIPQNPSLQQSSGIVGKAPSFLLALEKAQKAARSKCSVLILGETGTGKELIARVIHDFSRRSEHAFVPVNCGAFPADLIRSELFGHVKGAFTGADNKHDGLFTQANGGTIFLDELGELPLEQQPHLLRALESGLIRRVGGQHEELVNTRFVSATNRSCLNQSTSPLRSDLFHRLSTVIIELPALRERASDIPILVRHFLAEGIEEYGPREIDDDTLTALSRHVWRGNVRELRNSVARALTLGASRLHTRDFLPKGVELASDEPLASADPEQAGQGLSRFERNQRDLILAAYQRHGTIRKAAMELGMPKSTFADMCKRYGIDTRRRRRIKL
tara:strand:+ start:12498 stop:13697 length:1200 start_codon:yes stop_codon:yes gene_type:complete